MKRSIFAAFGLLLIIQGKVSGQTFEQYKSKYPDKQAIMLKKKEIVKFTLDKNDSLDITLNYNSEMLHLAEKTEGYAEGSIHFSDFIQLTEIDAKTLVPVKSSYKPLKVTEFTVKNNNSSGVFFDDSRLKVFNYPGVQPGAKTVLNYTQKFKEPRLLVPYYFNFYVPVLESELTIMVDKRLTIGHRLFNNENGKIKFTESTEGNFMVYRWSSKDLEEYTIESEAPSISYYAPHLVYFVQEIRTKKRNEILLKEVKDLYGWYYSLGIKNQAPVGKELVSIVDSLTEGVASMREKTRKIFYWVQDHVTYVAFEDGYGGFIPRDANLVCDRRFGDCKDMANLLVQMLTHAGIPAYHVWIGTRDIPYRYEELPAPNVDNHMIAAAKVDGQYIFLDATGKYSTLELPTSMIQGKEALVGIGKDQYEIVKIPVIEPAKNRITDTTYCRIENSLLKGRGTISLTGYNKVDYTYAYNYAKKDKRKEVIKDLCTKGSNKFSLLDHSISNLDDREKPFTVSYEYELDDYIKSNSGDIYINLNLDRPFDKGRIDTLKRKLPMERNHKLVQEDVIIFDIPKNYSIDYLPPSINEKSDFFEMEISYKADKSKIIYQKKIVVNTLMLERRDFYKWNSVINKLSQAYREVVVLKQK